MKVRGGPALLPLLSIALALFSYTGCGGKPEAKLAASGGTASIEAPDGLFVALTVTNESAAQAEDVQVSSVSIPGATLTLPASLPFAVGSIPRGRDTTLNANFSMPSVKPETDYLVRIAGTFREHGGSSRSRFNRTSAHLPGGPVPARRTPAPRPPTR